MTADLWWQRPFRMLQTNLREIDAGLDVDAVLDYIEDFGGDAWLLSVGGIISGYPTDLPFQTRNPALAQRESGDLVGDAVAAAHARGTRLLARMDFSKVDGRIAEQHPDWCFVDPAGHQQVYNGLFSVCPSGPYYQAKVFEILTEVLERYDVDGFFFNWLTYGEHDYEKRYRGVCQCASCVAAFAEFAPGVPLPSDPDSPAYLTWRRFTTTMIDDWTARVRKFIAGRRPEAPLIMGDTSDIVFHEANNAVDRPLWHHLCGEHASLAKTYRPQTPVLVNAAAFVDMPYRLAGEEPHAYEQCLVQAIARGANPSIYIMGTPETVEYECLGPARELIRFHRDHEDAYASYRPAARTVLVRPSDHADPASAKHSRAEFEGLWMALLERHIPFDVLAEERLTDLGEDGLNRYQLVILPDVGALAGAAARRLDAYVFGGGRMLATGSSGLDGGSPQLDAFGVIRRSAVRDTPELTWSAHLVPDAEPYPVPLFGAYHVLVAGPETETGMTMLSRAPYGPPEKCYGHHPLDQPGWISHPFGAGRSTIMPWTVGRGYRTLGLSAYRDLFVDQVLRLLDAELEIETDLPEQVEVIVARSEAGYLVHLRNLSGAGVQRFGVPLPIAPARLSIRGYGDLPRRARALVAARELTLERASAAQVSVELPVLGLFEVVVFS